MLSGTSSPSTTSFEYLQIIFSTRDSVASIISSTIITTSHTHCILHPKIWYQYVNWSICLMKSCTFCHLRACSQWLSGAYLVSSRVSSNCDLEAIHCSLVTGGAMWIGPEWNETSPCPIWLPKIFWCGLPKGAWKLIFFFLLRWQN